MKLILTNHGTAPVPAMSEDEGGWCENVAPGSPVTLDKTGSDVIIIGDKPNVSENIIKGLGTAFDAIKKILTLRKPTATPLSASDQLNFTIGNLGTDTIRVILGDGKTDAEVPSGVNYQAVATGYIEIRELGHAAKQGSTPD